MSEENQQQQQQQPPAEPEFVVTDEMRRPHGAIVTQIYAHEVGGFCTPAKEKLLADRHLAKTGILLRYSHEKPEEWNTRLDAFLNEKRPVRAAGVRMPKESARKELVRLERMYLNRDGAKKTDVVERKREDVDFAFMNELRALLGMPAHDYRKLGVPTVTEELEQALADLQTIVEPDARFAAVRTITNPDLLRLVMLSESHQSIRELAERRYGELMVTRR